MMTLEEILRSVVDLEYVLDWETVRAGFGFHKSRKIGSGVRFVGVRPEYVWPRGRINERASERAGDVYVNVFHTRRNVGVWFLVDLSGSMEFGATALKRERVARLAASIAYSCFRARDPFTLLGFADRLEPSVVITPELAGRDIPLRVAEAILGAKGFRVSSNGLREALECIPEAEPSLVFVASDFWPQEAFLPHVAEIADIHDVVPLVFRDVLEEMLPKESGYVSLVDAETSVELMIPFGERQRREFRAKIEEANRKLVVSFGRLGIDPVWCTSRKDERLSVVEYFARRLDA